MKTLIIIILMMSALISACTNNNSNVKEDATVNDSETISKEKNDHADIQPASVEEVVADYIQIKNALTQDNSKEAAAAGKQLQEALQKLDHASFDSSQKKVFNNVKEDINEHAEHISTNPDKLDHQREHFDMLSVDMYDLVKSVKPSRTLYKDFCPMYNNNKGAYWLSEEKDITNPYYGKKMLTCGSVKEEIK